MVRAAKKQAGKGRIGATGGQITSASMSDDERLDEIARILALGILRLRARQLENSPVRSGPEAGFGLDFAAEQSVCSNGPENDQKELCK